MSMDFQSLKKPVVDEGAEGCHERWGTAFKVLCPRKCLT